MKVRISRPMIVIGVIAVIVAITAALVVTVSDRPGRQRQPAPGGHLTPRPRPWHGPGRWVPEQRAVVRPAQVVARYGQQGATKVGTAYQTTVDTVETLDWRHAVHDRSR